jgi:ribonuclease T1
MPVSRILPIIIALAFIFVSALVPGCAPPVSQSPGIPPAQAIAASESGIKEISVNALPHEAIETLQLIKRGGPFPYKQDDGIFSNYEGLLPKQRNGYYREYTVTTPGASNRGARRIIAGAVGEYYYTADHYASFKLIVE